MSRFFTSDTHFGHANIIRLCNRPFKDVNHMNEEIVRRWNEVVSEDDIVYHLGDVALGTFADSINYVSRLNGYKILVPGNHDRIASFEKQSRIDRFMPIYENVFQAVMTETVQTDFALEYDAYGAPVVFADALLSHYPYSGDSHGEDRYTAQRAVDEGLPLIHGHTHGPEQVVWESRNGTPQYHVGQDAHNFYPVPESEIVAWLRSL